MKDVLRRRTAVCRAGGRAVGGRDPRAAPMTDVSRAAAYTWLIVSTVLFTAAALPFVVPADALFAGGIRGLRP
jgi:hypothetical protein